MYSKVWHDNASSSMHSIFVHMHLNFMQTLRCSLRNTAYLVILCRDVSEQATHVAIEPESMSGITNATPELGIPQSLQDAYDQLDQLPDLRHDGSGLCKYISADLPMPFQVAFFVLPSRAYRIFGDLFSRCVTVHMQSMSLQN